jgi:hypothetical protein
MDQRPSCRTLNSETTREKHAEEILQVLAQAIIFCIGLKKHRKQK